jgi:cell wall-associated NlpC family hydrolase
MKIKTILFLLFTYIGFSQKPAKNIGIVHVSVGNIRSQPAQSAELSTQALLGTQVKIIEKSTTNNWYQVELPDKYKGWIEGGAISRMDSMEYQKYRSSGIELIVTKSQSRLLKTKNKRAEIVSELIWHNRLKGIRRQGAFWEVQLSDGTKGFVLQKEVELYAKWLQKHAEPNPQHLIQTAQQLMGIPYLWGGTSLKGLDCSGFTKSIFLDNGLVIPRDASQQVKEGILVDSTKNWKNLTAGDLLFFGEKRKDGTLKVVHVGIWEGNENYLHASEKTKRASMNPSSPDFDAYNLMRYLLAKRIQGPDKEVQKLINLP